MAMVTIADGRGGRPNTADQNSGMPDACQTAKMAGSGSAAGRRGRLLTKIEISCTAVPVWL